MGDAQMLDKFQALNRERIERLSSLLPAKQQSFLEFIPLLFQANSSSLPGYINAETPAGIIDYRPSKLAIEAAKKQHHAYSYRHSALLNYPIRALYLINKTGLYHFNGDESFELWLIYAASLSPAQRTLLTQKANAIANWATAEGFKLDIILFDENLSSDRITAFDLDHLYSSGLLLAGCIPTWWIEDSKGNTTLTSHYAKDVVAFPAIATPSPQVVFDLAARQINQAMEQGLEACIDLIYLDLLLEQYPNTNWLSDTLKRILHNNDVDSMLLDVNTLKLQVISKHRNDQAKLNLARQSLYVKSKESLSKNIKTTKHPWRKEFIEDLVYSWQWSDEKIANLDPYARRHYRQCISRFKLVRDQISETLSVLLSFSQRHEIDTATQQRQLQQKYELLFEDQADSLNQLPPAFFPQYVEEHIYLYRKKNNLWAVNDQTEEMSKKPLYQHESLLNVLAWATHNHLISSSTRLKVTDETNTTKINIILELVQYLLRSQLNQKSETLDPSHLDNKPAIKHIMVFANLDSQASDSLSQHGLEVSSLQADPLNYANNKQNIIAKVEGFLHTDQEQWHYFSFSQNECILHMLSSFFHWEPSAFSATTVSCWSHYQNQSQRINSRLEKLITNACAHYQQTASNGEYILPVGGKHYQLHWQAGLCDISTLARNFSLKRHLSQKSDAFCNTAIDHTLDESNLYATLLQHQAENRISLFLYPENKNITLYLIDDLGILFSQSFHDLTEETLLHHFHSFLSKISPYTLDFFRLQHVKSVFNTTPLQLKSILKKPNYLPVIVEMDSADEGTQCSIRCGARIFTGEANKSALFSQVRDLILSLRKTNVNYPLYITELTFKQAGVTTQQHLIQKKRLEYLLNNLSN